MTKHELQQWFSALFDADNLAAINHEINSILNSTESELSEDGNVWICNPQTGHWAGREELAHLMERLDGV